MLQVGIHSDVVVSAVGKDDKSNLELTFKQVSGKPSLFGGSSLSGGAGETAKVKLWKLGVVNQFDTTKSLTFDDIKRQLDQYKDQLVHILSVYLTSDKVDEVVSDEVLVANTSLTGDNFQKEMLKEKTYSKVWDNLTNSFITAITPFLNAEEKFRIKFLRTSAKSNFPTLGKTFLNSNPFIESMAVNPSKLKFSDYEKGKRKEGQPEGTDLSSAERFDAGDADTPQQKADNVAAVNTLFGIK